MAGYVSPTTQVTGPSSSAWANSVKADLDFLADPCRCWAYTSAAQSIPNNVTTVVAFDAEYEDWLGAGVAGAAHDLVTNNSRIKPGVAGKYRVTANLNTTGGSATGMAATYINRNGTTIVGQSEAPPTGSLYSSVSSDVYLNGTTDYVEMAVFQNSGGTRALVTGQYGTFLQVRWVAIS